MISCSLSPNTEASDVWLAVRTLGSPWKWKRGSAIRKVESHFGGVAFNSGRAALYAILRSYGIGKGDEVLVQAFTCVAVSDAIRWTGATPVYVDISDSYTIDPDEIEKTCSKKTVAVIVQHTFGISAPMEKILPIAKKYRLRVIEDFAHTMSLPLRGDAGFYSFGRDKVLSSVFGGLAIMRDMTKLKQFQKQLDYPSYGWIAQQLFHPIAFSMILPLYRVGIGKVLLVLLQRIKFLSFPHTSEVRRYPNGLALLLLLQLKKLDRYTRERQTISQLYGGNVPYLRYPMLVDDPARCIARAKRKGILLGNWYHNIVDPVDPHYKKGSCPRAEIIASKIINLPTRISEADAKRILAIL